MYLDDQYTKQDFPCFKGDNFAIKQFYPNFQHDYCSPRICTNNTHQPFNVGKIQESDYKYLDKYITRFGQNAHSSTKELWNNDGSCYTKSQTEYFSTMVKLHKKYNIVEALAAKNIVPHKTKMYKTQDVLKVLTDLFEGYEPVLYCSIEQVDEKSKITIPSSIVQFNLNVDSQFKPIKNSDQYCFYSGCPYELNFPPIEY